MKKSEEKKGYFSKARTPEMIKKQRGAIINYYVQKRKEINDMEKRKQ